jgi:hypothetical protein
VNDLVPGDQIDLDRFELEYGSRAKRQLEDEIEGRGFVIDSRGKLGEVAYCDACDGGNDDKMCHQCKNYGMTVNFGKGLKPFCD